MRGVPATSVATFAAISTATLALAIGGAVGLARHFEWPLTSVPPFLLAIVLFHGTNLLALNALLRFFPFPTGPVVVGTRTDRVYGIYLLLTLFYVTPVVLSRWLPPLLTSLWYRFLGAQIGRQSFPSGAVLFDPHLIEMGDDVTLGYNCVLSPHIQVDDTLTHERIVLEDRVTIGVNTVVYGGTHIGAGSLVVANSSVLPGTRIGPNEMWGGNPARKIKDRDTPSPPVI